MKLALLIIASLGLNLVTFSQGFVKVDSEVSGIDFTNYIIQTDLVNGLTYEYLYNGGGVSIADFNCDGLEDIFFTVNQSQNRLYLNQGNLNFKDVTIKYFGKTQPEGYNTGSTIVDINNDGFMDIYVSRGGWYLEDDTRRNLLYINQGGKKFIEKGREFGVADSSCTTQAVFFDSDLDGDLDLYLLNHPLWRKKSQAIRTDQPSVHLGGQDAFYENVGDKFILATKKVGLFEDKSFGLGVVVTDLNGDGFPDIYVTNDYTEPDRFYLNRGDGTYINILKEAVNHISFYAMGSDIADINNDLLPDIFTVDMASEDHVRSKKNMGGMSSKTFWSYVQSGNHYQYMFNSLQLNLGKMKFAEISQLAGISKTDWSWAPLIADYDNDGFSDLFITNGYIVDVRDNDFMIHLQAEVTNSQEIIPFETIVKDAPKSKIPNYIFKNNGDLTFTNKVRDWGMSEPINASGAAYADLDSDGDLDLIVNSMNDPSYIMENKMGESGNYFQLSIKGLPKNYNCIGAKITIEAGNLTMKKELQVTRGFQSSVSPILHFGLGNCTKIDKLTIEWKKDDISVLNNIEANQRLTIDYLKTEHSIVSPKIAVGQIFTEEDIEGLRYKHEELVTDDFVKEILLPNQMSELGPFLTKGDLNGDKLDDIFIGGSRGYPSELFLQNEDGSFVRTLQESFKKDGNFEDLGSVIFDADNDGDNDLYVVSGSNECPINHPILQDRLYLNDGKGILTRSLDALPEMFVSGQKVLAYDFNSDGWMDIVSFGRQVPENYPKTPRSFILLNQKGKFVDVTKEFAPDLSEVGMVTDAIFSDFDDDKDNDLLIVGEWMPLTVFENEDGKFSNQTVKFGLEKTVGWWSTIAEYSSVGKKTYVCGNIGANNKFHPSSYKPLQIFMNDFDDNGTNDIVLAKNQGSICYPVRGRQCSSEQMPFIKEKFPTYSLFAEASLSAIYSTEKLAASIHFEATIFESSILTYSDKKFKVESLPSSCQLGAINVVLVSDFNKDGINDILMLGNKFEAEVETIRYDSNYGTLMLGNDNGTFSIVPNSESGIYLDYDIKSALLINTKNGNRIVTLPKRENVKVLKY